MVPRIYFGISLALLVSVLLVFPAFAQERGTVGRVIVDCAGKPETVTVKNLGSTKFVVTKVTITKYSREPSVTRGYDFGRADAILPGESITYYSGPASPGGDTTLTRQSLFPNVPTNRSVLSVTADLAPLGVEGGDITVDTSCARVVEDGVEHIGPGEVGFGCLDCVDDPAADFPALPATGGGGTKISGYPAVVTAILLAVASLSACTARSHQRRGAR